MEAEMTFRTRRAVLATLLVAGALGAAALCAASGPAAAWWPFPPDDPRPPGEARQLVNPKYLPPHNPEGPWAHVPRCQILVKAPSVPLPGVTQSDMRYCALPINAWRQASSPCSCALTTVDGERILQDGMVVWVPRWYTSILE